MFTKQLLVGLGGKRFSGRFSRLSCRKETPTLLHNIEIKVIH